MDAGLRPGHVLSPSSDPTLPTPPVDHGRRVPGSGPPPLRNDPSPLCQRPGGVEQRDTVETDSGDSEKVARGIDSVREVRRESPLRLLTGDSGRSSRHPRPSVWRSELDVSCRGDTTPSSAIPTRCSSWVRSPTRCSSWVSTSRGLFSLQ